MAISNPSRGGTAAEFGNSVNSEAIEASLAYAVSTPEIYDLVTRRKDLTGLNSYVWTVPIYSKVAAAASVADGAEPAPVALANTQAQVTAAMYMQHAFIGFQSRGVTVIDEMQVALNRMVDAVRLKIDTDVLALATSITATQGNASTENTFDNFVSAGSAFSALSKNSYGIYVMHADAVRDLKADLVGTAMMGSDAGVKQFADLNTGRQGAKMFSLGGFGILESDRMPVGDTTGWTNMIVEAGPQGALGLAFRRNEALDGVALLGGEPVPVHVQMIQSDTSPGHYVRAYSHHGVGIIDQSRAVNFITRT